MQEDVFKMSDESSKWPTGCGIYQIECLVSNKIYVGYAVNFKNRWGRHKSELRRGTYYNQYLLNSFNLYNECSFVFKVLELCEEEKLKKREWHWIKSLDSLNNGFNMVGYNDETPDILMSEPSNTKSFEFIDPSGNIVKGHNISKFARKVGGYQSAFAQVLRGEAFSHLGYKSTNPEFHMKPRQYRIVSPTFEVIEFSNILKFSAENGLNDDNISRVLRGLDSHFKGWHRENISDEHRIELEKYLPKPFSVFDPDGNFIQGDDLRAFCKERSLEKYLLEEVIKGETNSYLGYTGTYCAFPLKYKLISPKGEIFKFSSVKIFCKENNLQETSIRGVLNGTSLHCFGWRLPENINKTSRNFNFIQQADIETGLVIKIYPSLTSASRELSEKLSFSENYVSNGIRKCLRNERKSAFGFTWSRVNPVTLKK